MRAGSHSLAGCCRAQSGVLQRNGYFYLRPLIARVDVVMQVSDALTLLANIAETGTGVQQGNDISTCKSVADDGFVCHTPREGVYIENLRGGEGVLKEAGVGEGGLETSPWSPVSIEIVK